jgi:antitoxin MazE
MLVQLQKWGNSLAIRIPKSFAKETAIDQGSFLDLSLVDGKLVATPITETEYSLEALLAEVTEENIHTEIDTGEPAGKEIW